MFKAILVPLDESAYAERALRYAEDLSRLDGSRLRLLVVSPREYDPNSAESHSADPVTRLQSTRPARAERYLAEQTERLREGGLDAVDAEVRYGETATCIVDAARDSGSELIVMSTHGLGASGRYALGSVAFKVLMTAPCPVFMVRIQEAWPGPVPLE